MAELVDALDASEKWRTYMGGIEGATYYGPVEQEGTCPSVDVRLVINFHGGRPWGECEVPVFLIHFALASSEPLTRQEIEALEAGKRLTPAARQSFLYDPLSALLATRQLRGEIALYHLDRALCGTASVGPSECTGRPGSSLGMFRNNVAPRAWDLPLGWFMSPASFARIVEETAPDRFFTYRPNEDFPSDTEFLVYHLNPALYDAGARPSIGDLLPAP